jgi:hypothetical protein
MAEQVTLRGHHIDLLALAYFRETAPELCRSVTRDDACFDQKYNSEFRNSMDELLGRILKQPDTSVVPTAGLDGLCNLCPNTGDPRCDWTDPNRALDADHVILYASDFDRAIILVYGLEEGRAYQVSDLLERFKAYRQETGYLSPRSRFVQMWNKAIDDGLRQIDALRAQRAQQ